jgi:hypothetical protein
MFMVWLRNTKGENAAMKMIELQIRQEFNEPPSQVLQGFARMGYGYSATAQAIGCHRQTVKRLADRFGIQFPVPADQNAMCKRGLD